MRLVLALLAAAFASTLSAPRLAAHEFWLEPIAYRVAPGEPVAARAFNGENFFGIEYGYSEGAYKQSGIFAGNVSAPIAGISGQKPAVSVPAAGPGLNVLYHTSPLNSLIYANVTKFENFLKNMRLEAAMAQHRELRYPEADIKEVYFRYVKALVAVGDGAGADRVVGMPYELVALTNPYTDSGDMRFRLLLGGQPVAAGLPAFAFHKVGTSVEKIDLVTGPGGEIVLPRQPGAFMVNAVHLAVPPERIREVSKAHWMTLWAALTYEIR